MKSDKVFFWCFMALGIVLIIVLEFIVDLGRYDGKVTGAVIVLVVVIRALVGGEDEVREAGSTGGSKWAVPPAPCRWPGSLSKESCR